MWTVSWYISDLICDSVLTELCELPYTLHQGDVKRNGLPELQCANVSKTECGLVGQNAPGRAVLCAILYSVIKSMKAG